MCLYPKIIKNRKYTANKKNNGIIPEVKDKRTLAVPVGCGFCMECKKQKAREWQVRLQEEIRSNEDCKFVTLTFSNESYKELNNEIDEKIKYYERENAIATLGVRRFLERWRKKNKKSIKHWLITELGSNGTENIHIHGIIWSKEEEEIKEKWKYGHVWIGDYVNEKTINYIIKYVNKTDIKHKEYKSKILTSKGIGKGYIKREDAKNNKYNESKTNETYKTRTGLKLNLPVYYRNKIYTEEEKEKLWIKKLDEDVRYVNGIKIEMKTEAHEYYRTLEQERKKNKRLGYGDNEKNWIKEDYEQKRRELLNEKRLKT